MGSKYFICKIKAYENGSTASRNISISDGTTNNRLVFQISTVADRVSFFVIRANIQDATLNKNDITQTDWMTLGMTYELNNVAFWANGVKLAVDTSVIMPTGLNQLRFDSGAGAGAFIGALRFLEVGNVIPTDEQMAILTSNY